MFVAGFFPVHGLKIIQAPSVPKALKAFTANNGGTPPAWVAHFHARDLPAVMQMRRLGWHGTKEAFKAALDPIGDLTI